MCRRRRLFRRRRQRRFRLGRVRRWSLVPNHLTTFSFAGPNTHKDTHTPHWLSNYPKFLRAQERMDSLQICAVQLAKWSGNEKQATQRTESRQRPAHTAFRYLALRLNAVKKSLSSWMNALPSFHMMHDHCRFAGGLWDGPQAGDMYQNHIVIGVNACTK